MKPSVISRLLFILSNWISPFQLKPLHHIEWISCSFQMIYRINAKQQNIKKCVKERKLFLFSITHHGWYRLRRTVGSLDGVDLWMGRISLAYWHWLQIISVVFEGLTVAWCCLQRCVRLMRSCGGCGWLMMRKVSQTGSLALHFQTTSRGVGFTVFNQPFTYDDSLSTFTQWNVMTTMKLG